ncbi:lisH domain-containing protein ARMC9-like isoform X1 [Metopolophium dirhodum]|uniref:lisH domain-containing protein ARMC9-like isoform X1 n=3 Tax=Metopolophium dirhodum TaxID=44670 RepID=UPI00298F46DB|nr:lisH domain-containing protein ARMC9-like isoform X1 [Metopolophium dirhodum]
MDRLRKYSTSEAKTLQYIYEFLLSNNMTKTSACFIEECHKLNMPAPVFAAQSTKICNNNSVHLSKDRAATIIQSFKSASRLTFMKTWGDLPDEIKQIDEYRKLTFYLHVYYTILECKKRVNKSENCSDDKCDENNESSMGAFRTFLLQRGAEFSTENEFLPYFALPYVFEPMQHPSFKNLFKENRWCDSLNKRLEDFILDIAISTSMTLVPSRDAGKRKLTKKKFKTLYKEYKPLNALAAELLNALENSIRGQSINLEIILKNCNAVVENNDDNEQNLEIADDQFDLSIFKIKLELRDGNSTKNKLLILQALRWRLTKSENRTETVVMIKKYDLLDLCKPKAEQGLMKWLMMTNGPHPLQQMISRLLNALASFNRGRKYLADSPFLLRLIITQLISSQHFWDTITSNMLLGTLQKLSMGSRIRKRMIGNGLTTWLADQLVRKSEFTGDRNKYEMYDLEYSLGLFMNLCQCQTAVRACGSRARNLFKSLGVFMTTLDVDIMPCISGILYNMFKSPEMMVVAKEEGMTGIVEKTIESNINAYPSAVERLVDVRNMLLQNEHPAFDQSSSDDEYDYFNDDSGDDEDDSSNSDEDDDDVDNLEPELDEDDPLKIQPNGEDFLANYKTCNNTKHTTSDRYNNNNILL